MRLFASHQLYKLERKVFLKTLLFMNLTIALLLSISLAAGAKGYSQKVSLAEKNASLKKIFREIKRQTGYMFVYTDPILRKAKKITVNVNSVTLEEALNACLQDQPL